MYLYIYTVYVIVEHEMWHFIFEGLFVYFFKTARKDVTLRQNEMIKRILLMVKERVEKINDKINFLEETRKRKMRELQH